MSSMTFFPVGDASDPSVLYAPPDIGCEVNLIPSDLEPSSSTCMDPITSEPVHTTFCHPHEADCLVHGSGGDGVGGGGGGFYSSLVWLRETNSSSLEDIAHEPLACAEQSEFSDHETSPSESEEESEPDSGDDSEYEVTRSRRRSRPRGVYPPLPSPRREEKNAKERQRISKKNEALLKLGQQVVESDLIGDEVKQQRLTEEYTLKQALSLIGALRSEIRKYGRPSSVPLPFAQK